MAARSRSSYPFPQLLASFSKVARKEIRKNFRADSCIASTKITLKVFKYFGYRGHAVPVSLIIENDEFRQWREATSGSKALERTIPLSPKAWSVAVGHEDPVGHVVAWVENKFLVDASIDQAARPHKGIVLPPVFFAETETFLRDGSLVGTLGQPEDKQLLIAYLVQTKKLAYQRSPDWLDDNRTAPVVKRVVELVQNSLE